MNRKIPNRHQDVNDEIKDHKLVDAHIHLWDLHKLSYPWLSSVPEIRQDYLLKDYFSATVEKEIEAMVFVQAECKSEQFLDELKWIQSIADSEKRLKGIIPWAPIHTGNSVESILEEFKKDHRIKGVRHIIQSEIDPAFCQSQKYIDGVRLLGQYELHFELTIDPLQFPAVMKLVEQCPDTKFILDHIGNPDISNLRLSPWKDYLKEFADSGSHFCKFSNLVCNADLQNWTIKDLKPFSETVIEVFGAERLIWGSDWPHALRASSWNRWYSASVELVKEFTENEKQLFYRENAINFYRL